MPRYPEEHLNKYADESYLSVPSVNLIPEELDHVEWA